MDLQSLFAQLQTTQQAKTKVRLSERNVIELVNKLKQLGILGEDLLHTINGKEYITTQRLKQEIQLALKQAGGRLALVELPALLGVDLAHCERQAAALVAESNGFIIEAQGELLTQQYFEAISAEINDLLQESGQLGIAELALQYTLNTELLLNILKQNIGARIQGRLQSGLLYTPAALRRLKAQLRGALRGTLQPCTLPSLIKELGLENLASSSTMVAQLVEELLSGGQVAGVLKAGGASWTPHIYATTQEAALTAFYQSNGWVACDMARRLGFSNEKAHLTKTFPDGIALESAYVSPSVLSHVTASVEEALAAGSWLDVGPLLPSVLNSADVATLLERLPQLKQTGKDSGAKTGTAGRAAAGKQAASETATPQGPLLLAGTCVVSSQLIMSLSERVKVTAGQAAEKALQEKRVAAQPVNPSPSQAKAASMAEDDDDNDWGTGPKKGKGGKGGKAAGKGKGSGKSADNSKANLSQAGGVSSTVGVDESMITDLVLETHPDMDGAGEEGQLIPALSQTLMPVAVSAWQATLAAALTAGAEGRRQAKEAVTKALEEAFFQFCLYSNGNDLFTTGGPADPDITTSDDSRNSKTGKAAKGSKANTSESSKAGNDTATDTAEEGTFQLLERHAVRTSGAECTDLMFKWAQIEISASQGGNLPPALQSPGNIASSPPLTAAERSAVIRNAPPDMAAGLQAALQVTSASSSKAALSTLEEAAEQLGLRLRRPDKKSEKAGVSNVKSHLLGLLSRETDPAAVLALAVPLLFIKATGHAITLPGKAIGGVLQKIQKDLPEQHMTAIQEFHSLVVEYLKASANPQGAPALAEELSNRQATIKEMTGRACIATATMDRSSMKAAAQSSQGNAETGPMSLSSASQFRFRSMLPQRWQRLQQQVEGKDYSLPTSGAHVTLQDLIKDTERHLAGSGAEDDIDTDISQPYAPDDKVPGWFGTPDPTKYAPGTTCLSLEELEAEIKAGNVIAFADWRKAIEELEPWRRELLHRILLQEYAKDRMLIDVPEEGGKVSYYNLMQYVEHNPELKALVERHRSIVDSQGENLQGAGHLLPLQSGAGQVYATGTREQLKNMPWTCVGGGLVWRKKPSKWLKGMDGKLDFEYSVFVHEAQAHKLLGPTWAGRPSRDVLPSQQYWDDIIAAGPAMGMTFVVAAARDVPIQEAAQSWTEHISRRMTALGATQETIQSAISGIGQLVDPGKLIAETRLANSLGTTIRKGSTLMLTTLPEGKLLVQAMSPDPVRVREHYLLGSIHHCSALQSALTTLALGAGPQKRSLPPLDDDIVPSAGWNMLLEANGYVANDPESSGPNIQLRRTSDQPPAVLKVAHPRLPMFRLPEHGKQEESSSAPPVVLEGVQEAITLSSLRDVFATAAEAADQACSQLQEGLSKSEIIEIRRKAAQDALSKGIKSLGIELGNGQSPSDLFSLARPLAAQGGSQ